MNNTSDADLCDSQPDCGEVTDEKQKDVVFETDLPFTEDGLENRSNSTEDVTSQTDDNSYYVTWTVYIALAVPKGEGADVPEAPEKLRKTNKGSSAVLLKAHKAQSCYHIEYKLLSSDSEPVKVDLVLFGPVAKIYREEESKIVRTWHEGDQLWIGWSQNFNIRVNRDMLVCLLPHKIKLKMWNSKDKLSSKARYERLKVFRMQQDQLDEATDMCGDIKTMVNKVRCLCLKKSFTFTKCKSDILFNSNSEVRSETDKNLDPQINSVFPNLTTDAEDVEKNVTTSVEFSPISLLAGETSLAECFTVGSLSILEILCNISLDRPLISDQLKAELNPLVITILSANSMPSSPVPFHVLQDKCMPVYCQYKFHNLSVHRTNYHKQATNIYFRDVNVILSGLMSHGELQEFLSGQPLQIEVHDRDRKLEKTPETAAMFDTGSADGIQSKAALFKQKTMCFNPHGIAELNLSELLLGKKSINVHLPIKCCPLPPLLDRERRPWNENVTDKVASRDSMPPGHFIDSNSKLKVTVELACPLSVKDDSCDLESSDGLFGRIIYLFNYNNVSVMTKLRSEILTINASAFQLCSCSQENIQIALSNHIINFKHNESKDLDFVTGFHVQDRRTHIFVLEGLKQKAVRRLWEAVPMKLSGSEEEQVRVLYNSNLGFFKRIYDSLDVGLSPIYLNDALENIMRRPVIYIRGMVPQPCFQALSRLSQLCHIQQLKDIVQYNLFPSADMIVSMKKEYGTYDEQFEPKEGADTEVNIPTLTVQIKKKRTQLDTNNREFTRWKHNVQQKDFIQENIKKVQEESKRMQKPAAAVLKVDQSSDRPAHNYSIQTFNSNEQAKELLQKMMAKVPGQRFTYSQQYHSATVEPGDVTPKNAANFIAPSTVWITSMSSDKPRHPDGARVDELRKPWRENILHANTLKPTLSRDRWTWSQRYEDFQLYRKPPPFFSAPPVTIHLAGDTLQQEQLEAATAQYSRWLKKLLPGVSTNPPNGPISEFKCHMGVKSETIQDILKDEPKKYSLRKPGLMLKPFPQLSVMNPGYDKAKETESMALAPGPCNNCSLSSKNVVPRHTSLYKKYQFIGFSKQHSFLYKRTVLPLSDEEKRIFTFHTPTVQAFRNTAEDTTHKQSTY
ncbi:hypothetical protein Q5P01_002169 [Channa striata]|uniref:DUF4550 domain-containing protein n=1 Tax=Channa striata TaxID=64152 RepID=A0AA88T3H5_CHASR|nr:hypothetical protein Q5P01_002169 [Channa striata]